MRHGPVRIAASLIAFAVIAFAGCAAQNVTVGSLPVRTPDRCGVAAPGVSAGGLDIAIAINTSTSTSRPSGRDVDADGEIGELRSSVVTDRGDSLLSGQVAAAKSLLHGGALPDARVSIITYSGLARAPERSRPVGSVPLRVGRILAGLTSDVAALDAALDHALDRGSRGGVDFAAAVELSIRSLRAGEGDTARRRMILLLSNSPTPILAAPSVANFRKEHGEDPNGAFLRDDPALIAAARRAIRYETTIHGFAIGPAASATTPHLLSRLARATGGTHRSVDDVRDLDCELLAALATPAPRGGS